MTDVTFPVAAGGTKKLKDQLDGTHAEVVYAVLATNPTITIGRVQGTVAKVAVTPTVTAATYAVSKVIGGIMTFAGILPATPFGGVLESIAVKFKGSAQTVGFWVAIFDASPAGTFTDTNTAAINAADTAHLLGAYHLTTPMSLLGTHTVFSLDNIGKALQGASANLYVVVVPDATTLALGSTSDMTVELGMQWS
jgi:hypothetical protein